MSGETQPQPDTSQPAQPLDNPVVKPPVKTEPVKPPTAPDTLEAPLQIPGKVQIAKLSSQGTPIVEALVTDAKAASVRPVWSPDWKEIWFLSQKDAPEGTYIPWKASPDGRQLRPVASRENGFPLVYGGGAWSPKRDRIAYVQDKDGYLQIMVDDLKGHVASVTPDTTGEAKRRRVENATDYWAYWPVWSPAGELAFLTTRNDNLDIMLIDTEGNTRALTQTPALEMYPAWSPDGTKLAFYRSQRDGTGNRTDQVWVIDKNGGEGSPVTPPMGADSLVPAWSPDGKRLAINAGFTEPQAGARQRGLWLVNADGKDLVMVYNQGGGRLVSWSPDGKKVAFNDAAGRLYVLVLSDQPGKHEVLAVTSTPDVGGMNVTWSQDSRQLLFDWAEPGKPRGIWVAKLPDTRPNP